MAERSLTSCVWARFPDRLSGQHSQLTPTSLGHEYGVCVFRCNLPLHFWQYDRGLLPFHWGNTEMERTPKKIQHRKLIPRKKMLPPLLPGIETQLSDHEFGRGGGERERTSIMTAHVPYGLLQTFIRLLCVGKGRQLWHEIFDRHTHIHTQNLSFDTSATVLSALLKHSNES